MEKECPLKIAGFYANTGQQGCVCSCSEEECAWWDSRRGCCAIVGLIEVIDSIGGMLNR